LTDINTKIEPPKAITTYFHAFVVPPRGMAIFKKMHIILKIPVNVVVPVMGHPVVLTDIYPFKSSSMKYEKI